jgi:anti-anti-sigma factor
MPLNVRVQEGRDLTKTIALQGRLDNETVAEFDVRLDALLASAVKVIVFDLAGLEYITSAGLRSIFRTQKALAARAGRILVLNPRPPVQKVLDIVKALETGSIFRSVEELDRYLDAMQKKVAASV